MPTIIIQIFIFFLFFSIGSGLLLLYEANRENSNATKSVCHFGVPLEDSVINNKTNWSPTAIQNWKQPYNLFFFLNTKNELNYKNNVRSFVNTHFELYHNKNLNNRNLYIFRKKITKLVKSRSKCPEEPAFLYNTHLFCMVKKLMIETFPNKKIRNFYETLAKNAILFFLAEKHGVNVKLRLVVKMDNYNRLKNYSLSVVRTEIDENFYFDKLIAEQFGEYDEKNNTKKIRSDRRYRKNQKIIKIIDEFDVEKYKCNLKFFLQEDTEDLFRLKFLHDYKIQNIKNELLEKTHYVLISQNVIEKDVNLVLEHLAEVDIPDLYRYNEDLNNEDSNEFVDKSILMEIRFTNESQISANPDLNSQHSNEKIDKLYNLENIYSLIKNKTQQGRITDRIYNETEQNLAPENTVSINKTSDNYISNNNVTKAIDYENTTLEYINIEPNVLQSNNSHGSENNNLNNSGNKNEEVYDSLSQIDDLTTEQTSNVTIPNIKKMSIYERKRSISSNSYSNKKSNPLTNNFSFNNQEPFNDRRPIFNLDPILILKSDSIKKKDSNGKNESAYLQIQSKQNNTEFKKDQPDITENFQKLYQKIQKSNGTYKRDILNSRNRKISNNTNTDLTEDQYNEILTFYRRKNYYENKTTPKRQRNPYRIKNMDRKSKQRFNIKKTSSNVRVEEDPLSDNKAIPENEDFRRDKSNDTSYLKRREMFYFVFNRSLVPSN